MTIEINFLFQQFESFSEKFEVHVIADIKMDMIRT